MRILSLIIFFSSSALASDYSLTFTGKDGQEEVWDQDRIYLSIRTMGVVLGNKNKKAKKEFLVLHKSFTSKDSAWSENINKDEFEQLANVYKAALKTAKDTERQKNNENKLNEQRAESNKRQWRLFEIQQGFTWNNRDNYGEHIKLAESESSDGGKIITNSEYDKLLKLSKQKVIPSPHKKKVVKAKPKNTRTTTSFDMANLERLDELGDKMANASSGRVSSVYKRYIAESMKPNSWGGSKITDKEYQIISSEKTLLEFADKKGSFINGK